jgi:aconitate hydratase
MQSIQSAGDRPPITEALGSPALEHPVADPRDPFGARQPFNLGSGQTGHLYSLAAIERAGLGGVSRMPVCLRVILESVLRNCDGRRVHEADVRRLAAWRPRATREAEVPFLVARILLQDFTGVPVLVDLAAMRSAIARLGRDPATIEPLVPVDLVVDHSVQVDYWTREDALWLNMQKEMERNRRRYDFLKWGAQAFRGFNVVPPGVGICHQVNLERLATCVTEKDGVYYPDTLVGTDSHTTMVNGLGVVGWGVGGIEAEAGMLGQPIYILEPDVIGVHITGELPTGATATDAVLAVTEMLRKYKVVGKFVEYFGSGAESLTVPDRATIANMAPEYGATMGFFPVDEQTCRYLLDTGRAPEHVEAVRAYYRAQGMFGIPKAGDIDYTAVLDFDLSKVTASVAGPRRPQDRIELPKVKENFGNLLRTPFAAGGFGKSDEDACKRVAIRAGLDRRFPTRVTLAGGGSQDPETVPTSPAPLTSERNTNPETEIEMMQNRPTPDRVEEVPHGELPRVAVELGHGSIAIAAITSCTNTSNPGVMLAAGLLAKKAVERGLHVPPVVKASLAPGSRVVTRYLDRLGLQPYLDKLGFNTVGYGCTTCIGNSGPLDPKVEQAVHANDLVVAAVLSGNRNFEARIHQSVKANFLMSPPLVVAFALVGRVDVDLANDSIGIGPDGKPVYLRDLWPSTAEVAEALRRASDPEEYRRLYADFRGQNPLWDEIPAGTGTRFEWDPASTYVREPPYFDRFSLEPEPCRRIENARALAIFGDSLTTDHISPAGAITANSPAGRFLLEHGVPEDDFNTYGSRRGNDRVMVRGTFANTRIKNLMLPGTEGGYTIHHPDGERMSIYDAAFRYQAAGIPLLVLAGQEYGTGSSRDWAAKGTRLLGVGAVIAESFERIHRSNLVQMGVLPCQFREGEGVKSLRLDGSETFDLTGLDCDVRPRQEVTLVIHRANGETAQAALHARIDTPIEADYYRHGGILPYMLRQLAK